MSESMSESMLPPNATELEQRLVEATRFDGLPAPLRDLWNPDTCPADLLPWLAWSWSVEHWESDWTEAQKRAVIGDAVYMHRHKGTLGAVKRALSTLGYRAEVSEWFDHDGNPYTFRIAFDNFFEDDDAYRRFIRLIDSAKNVRSLLELISQQREISQPLRIGIAVQSATVSTIALPAPVSEVAPHGLRLGTARQVATTHTIGPALSLTVAPRAASITAAYQTARITTIHEANHG